MSTLATGTQGYYLKQGTTTPEWDEVSTTYARAATKVVCASSSIDTTNCDYVCVGTADQVQINAALVAGAGGKVVLLEGNYQITANLIVPASTHFSGVGKGTILTTTDAVGITNMVVVNGDSITISDMKLVLGAGAGDAGSRPNVIYASSRTNILLENLWLYGDNTVDDGVRDRQNGIYFTTTTDSKITNNRIENNKVSGINLDAASNYNTISGNICTNCGGDGIEVRDSDYNIVVSNHCYANTNGIDNYTGSDYNTYDSNVCSGNTSGGIHLSSGTTNEVVGNTLNANAVGINPCGAVYTNITGNFCYNNSGHGIQLNGDYNTVTGNIVWSDGSTHAAIYVSGSDYSVVSGNSCFGTGGGISCSNITNTTITGNLCMGGVGIKLSGSNHNTITGNTCSDSPGGSGIIIQESHYNTVSGNTCENNAAEGIYIYCSSYNTVSGNTSTGNPEGIYVRGISGKEANYNLVTSNSIRDNTYNIDISGGAYANHNRIIDNEVSGGTDVLDAGTDTEFNEVFIDVPAPDGNIGTHVAKVLTDGSDITVRFDVLIPMEFQVLVSANIVIVPGGTGNLRRNVNTNFGKICADEAYSTTTDTIAVGVVAVTQNELECLDIAAALDGIAGGDMVGVEFIRSATHADDTVDANCYLIGFRLEYQ